MRELVHLKVLNELFDMLPTDTVYAGEVAGMKIYTNTAMKSYTKNWIKDHPSTKEIATRLERAIDEKKIVIGHTSSNLLSFLATKTLKTFIGVISAVVIGKPSNGTTLGFYTPSEKMIVILLDGNTSMLGKSYYPIPYILVHESIHMIAGIDPVNFYNHTKDTLHTYYKSFTQNIITSITDIHTVVSDSLLDEVIKKLLDTAEISPAANSTPVYLPALYEIWKRFYNAAVHDAGIAEDCADLSFVMLMGITTGETIPNDMRDTAAKCFSKAYDAIGIHMPETIPGQEIIFPSEIIAISNQKNPAPEIVTMINDSKF